MNLKNYTEHTPHQFKRIVWNILNISIFRLLIGSKMRYARNFLLKSFGAELPLHVMIYPSVNIYAPWNLKLGKYSCIGPRVNIYNKAKISIGDNTVISQDTTLCTAGHDITDPCHSLITSPIVIASQVWVAAEVFIGMGITIGEGAVVGARSALFHNVEPWTVVGGNPAKFIKKRVLRDA